MENVETKSAKNLIPFGLGQNKPHHFRDMVRIAWENKDNLGYAWKVLSKGVCDGCALGVTGFHDWTIEGVHLCMTRLNLLRLNTMPELDHSVLTSEAGFSRLRNLDNVQLRKLGRLAYPMRRRNGEKCFQRISWDEATRSIAAKIRTLSPNRFGFYLTSRAITNEVYYVAQKVARFLGTNNIENAARLCHSPSTGAMKTTLGWAASTCSYTDWIGTDLIVFFGSNPANDQPVTTKYLAEAKKRGTKFVVVNPYREPGMERYWVPSLLKSAVFGTSLMDYWVPVGLGGDIALIYGVLKVLFSEGWHDKSFVASHTEGVESVIEKTKALSWEEIERDSSVSRDTIHGFAKLLFESKNAVFVWSMGITQHKYGGDAVQMILNLGLACGYVGREKCGLVPIRGHSGVQGGSEMGAYATSFPGSIAITKESANTLSKQYGFPISDLPGLTSTEMIGNLDLLYSLGGNFLRTLPEPEKVARLMQEISVRVHQDIILTDQMFLDAKEAVYLLPANTRYEQDGGGTQTTTERRVLFSPEISRQIGESKAEWKILLEIASDAYPERKHLLKCETADKIREEIADIVPIYRGIEKLGQQNPQFQYGGARLFDGGKFWTKDGKAHFRKVELPDLEQKAGYFTVSTRRGKQFNTMVFAEKDPLTGAERDAIFINPEDANELNISQNDLIILVNKQGRYQGRAFLVPIQKRNLQIHFPEGNVILPTGPIDPIGGIPDYNAQVRIEKL